MQYFVYILRCKDESLYVGITNNVQRRVTEHIAGVDINCYTYKRRPVELAYCVSFKDVRNAISWEKQIKKWSRKKKEALIKGDQEGLERAAKNGMIRRIRKIREQTNERICRGVMVSTDEP